MLRFVETFNTDVKVTLASDQINDIALGKFKNKYWPNPSAA